MKWTLAVLMAVAAMAAVSAAERYNPNGTPIYDLNKAYDYYLKFMRDYGRVYDFKTAADFMKRFEIFKQNLVDINRKNAKAGPHGAQFGISKFADLTSSEVLTGSTEFPI